MDKYYSNNEFDVNEFNKAFEEQQVNDNKEKEELDMMKKVIEKEKLHDMSLGKILINMKDEIFGILYDLISINYESFDTFLDIFTKNNRLFYIGLFLIIICIFLYLISYFFHTDNDNDININANLNVPNDYKFRHFPYNKQDAPNVVESKRNTIIKRNNALLKRNLLNKEKVIDKMKNEIKVLKNKIDVDNDIDVGDSYKYEVDDEMIDSDIIPAEIKNQIKQQVEKDISNGKYI